MLLSNKAIMCASAYETAKQQDGGAWSKEDTAEKIKNYSDVMGWTQRY